MAEKKKKSSSNRRQQLAQAQKKKNRVLYIVLGIVAVIIIVVAVIAVRQKPAQVVLGDIIPRTQTDGLTAGDPNAPVVVEEFSDYGCGGCVGFATQLEKAFVEKYINTGQVYFKYSPTTWHDQNAQGAISSYCANEQGKFWEYHDLLFANAATPKNNTLLKGLAETLGMNLKDFEKCLTSGKFDAQIQADLQHALDSNIEFTPSFVVNGVIVGTQDLEKTVQDALAK